MLSYSEFLLAFASAILTTNPPMLWQIKNRGLDDEFCTKLAPRAHSKLHPFSQVYNSHSWPADPTPASVNRPPTCSMSSPPRSHRERTSTLSHDAPPSSPQASPSSEPPVPSYYHCYFRCSPSSRSSGSRACPSFAGSSASRARQSSFPQGRRGTRSLRDRPPDMVL